MSRSILSAFVLNLRSNFGSSSSYVQRSPHLQPAAQPPSEQAQPAPTPKPQPGPGEHEQRRQQLHPQQPQQPQRQPQPRVLPCTASSNASSNESFSPQEIVIISGSPPLFRPYVPAACPDPWPHPRVGPVPSVRTKRSSTIADARKRQAPASRFSQFSMKGRAGPIGSGRKQAEGAGEWRLVEDRPKGAAPAPRLPAALRLRLRIGTLGSFRRAARGSSLARGRSGQGAPQLATVGAAASFFSCSSAFFPHS